MTTRRRPPTPAPILPGFGPGPGGSPTASPDAPPCVREALAYFQRVHARPDGEPVSNPAEAAAVAACLLAAAGPQAAGIEMTGILCLNAGNRITHARILSFGTVNQAPVYPREIARIALNAEATGVILIHNHPGGQAHASTDDLKLTQHLSTALKAIEINLLDHLILTGEAAYSIMSGRTVQLADAV